MSVMKHAWHRTALMLLVLSLPAASIAVGTQLPTERPIWKWCEDFAKARWFRCSFRFDGFPEIAEDEQPASLRIDRTIQVQWPDAMIWSSQVWPAGQEVNSPSSKPRSEFFRRFRSDATVSASTNRGSIVTSAFPTLFAEDAWRYSYISPWLFAQLMFAENRDSVVIERTGNRALVRLIDVGVTATFDIGQNDSEVRLVELRIVERSSGLDTTFRYSDFRQGGPGGQFVPWRFTAVGSFQIVNRSTRRVKLSARQEIGTGSIVSCEWPALIAESEFEFPADILRNTKRESALRARLNQGAGLPPLVGAPTTDGTQQSAANVPASISGTQKNSRVWRPWALMGLGGFFVVATVWLTRRYVRQ